MRQITHYIMKEKSILLMKFQIAFEAETTRNKGVLMFIERERESSDKNKSEPVRFYAHSKTSFDVIWFINNHIYAIRLIPSGKLINRAQKKFNENFEKNSNGIIRNLSENDIENFIQKIIKEQKRG